MERKQVNMERKPEWLRISVQIDENYYHVRKLLKKHHLNTVCDEARCPNENECFRKKTATFMILGKQCTRNCRFCAVGKKEPEPLNENEPLNVAAAVSDLGLKYVVITSVTRDDLPDGGALHFADTIRKIKEMNPGTSIEVLVPDFKGDLSALKMVADASPDVIGHNMETVPSLYQSVRPMAVYERSLTVIENIKKLDRKIISKSGIMLGLGETETEVLRLFSDLLTAGCDILTIGQYLAPTKEHYPVSEYIKPEVFEAYKKKAEQLGFLYCASSPFTRSSYLAEEGFSLLTSRNKNSEDETAALK